jgi:hypothetical protein
MVSQDLSKTTFVEDNDVNLIENDYVNFTTTHTHQIENDNSSTITLNNDFNNVVNDNSVTNIVDAREVNFITVQEVTNLFDASRNVVIQNIQAPERAGGDILVGNA